MFLTAHSNGRGMTAVCLQCRLPVVLFLLTICFLPTYNAQAKSWDSCFSIGEKIPGNNEYRSPYIFSELTGVYYNDKNYKECDTNTSHNEVLVSLSKIELVWLSEKPYQHAGGRFISAFLELDRTAPYLDINEDGKEITINADGNCSKCLKFTEALGILGFWRNWKRR